MVFVVVVVVVVVAVVVVAVVVVVGRHLQLYGELGGHVMYEIALVDDYRLACNLL